MQSFRNRRISWGDVLGVALVAVGGMALQAGQVSAAPTVVPVYADPGTPPTRSVVTDVVVDVPAEEYWKLLSTSEGCIKLWGVALADVDFRTGGTIRANYDAKGKIGDAGTITHHILAYEPARMLALKTDAPAEAPESIKLICREGWTVIRLEPLDAGHTRIVETMMGFGDGPVFDEAYEFFKKGNAWTAEQMKKKLARADAAASADRVMALLGSMVGGEWIHEGHPPAGGVFRVRNLLELGPDGKTIVSKGWLGTQDGMLFHGVAQMWRDPETGGVLFQNINEQGHLARGAITLKDDSTLFWDWNEVGSGGGRYAIEMAMGPADAYRMRLGQCQPDGSVMAMVDAEFRRVLETPAEFKKMRDGSTAKDAAGTSSGTAAQARDSGSGAARSAAAVPSAAIEPASFASSGAVPAGVVKEIIVNATPQAAFDALATSAGWKKCFEVESKIELRIGGPFEIYFGSDAPAGQRGSEGCHVLSYIPARLLSFSWNAPPKFPEERFRHTWVVVTFAPTADGKTAVRLEHLGFGEGGRWPEVRAYFDHAWGSVLDAMQTAFAKG